MARKSRYGWIKTLSAWLAGVGGAVHILLAVLGFDVISKLGNLGVWAQAIVGIAGVYIAWLVLKK